MLGGRRYWELSDEDFAQWVEASREFFSKFKKFPLSAPFDERLEYLLERRRQWGVLCSDAGDETTSQEFAQADQGPGSERSSTYGILLGELFGRARSGASLTFATVSAVVFMVLVLFSAVDATAVRSGSQGFLSASGFFGYSATPVTIVQGEESVGFTDNGTLFLLGQSDTTLIFFDHRLDAVIRARVGSAPITLSERQ